MQNTARQISQNWVSCLVKPSPLRLVLTVNCTGGFTKFLSDGPDRIIVLKVTTAALSSTCTWAALVLNSKLPVFLFFILFITTELNFSSPAKWLYALKTFLHPVWSKISTERVQQDPIFSLIFHLLWITEKLWLKRTSRSHLVKPACSSRATYSQLPRNTSKHLLNIFKEEC